jgi:hypothetical protein
MVILPHLQRVENKKALYLRTSQTVIMLLASLLTVRERTSRKISPVSSSLGIAVCFVRACNCCALDLHLDDICAIMAVWSAAVMTHL